MATKIVRRYPSAAGRPVADTSSEMVRKALSAGKNAQSWTYYDTRYIGALAFSGDPGVFNFAQLQAMTPFFNARTTGNSSFAYTSNSDQNKFDGECTAQDFVREVVEGGALLISFGSDPVFVAPISDLPAGGGPLYGSRVRTVLAAGAVSDSGGASNGVPDSRAKRYLRAPLSFKQSQAFSISIVLAQPGCLARIQALQPLAGNQTAMIRVKLEGIRGKPLLEGVSQNPAGLAPYNRQLA